MKTKANINPWLWIPTLYFAEGIPYFIVNNISVIMFTNMGMSKGEMALYTSLLYLPWVIKPLWSPFVDIIKTKRWWIMAMQVLMSAAFVALALSLPHPSAEVIASGSTGVSMFAVTLVLFWITAFASATHDIAADGFYMLALSPGDQSLFVGIRSTFYRLSSIFGQGVLVVHHPCCECSHIRCRDPVAYIPSPTSCAGFFQDRRCIRRSAEDIRGVRQDIRDLLPKEACLDCDGVHAALPSS